MKGELAWVALYRLVSADFVVDGVPASNLFGWRVPAQHPIGNRIAWVPGDPNGLVGQTLPPRNPGGDPRPLATLGELFTILINGQDPAEPENELTQYKIVRYLRDAWYRSVYKFAHGVFTIRGEQWDTTRLERRHGAALRIVVELQAAVVDEDWHGDPSYVDVAPDAKAVIDVTELDVTEQIEIKATDS